MADHLLRLALERRYGSGAGDAITPLNDAEEWRAHNSVMRRLGVAHAETTA
jgi:hypothetical protein